MTYIRPNAAAGPELEGRITRALAERLLNAENYNAEEIRSVTGADTRLFPSEFKLNPELGEDLRMLARFSAAELRTPSQIKSHRRVIGPAIVALKRLVWPLIRAQLKDAFIQLEEFNSRMLQLAALLVAENSELKRQLGR